MWSLQRLLTASSTWPLHESHVLIFRIVFLKKMYHIFEIKHVIANHTQGTYSLATYYTILEGYWDDLSSYDSYIVYTWEGFNTYIH